MIHMKVYKNQILILFFTIATAVAFGQKQQPDSVAHVVNAIANSNIYEITYTVGYTGTISKQYERAQLLASLATEQQLLDIAAHSRNAVVRLYALQVLRQKKIAIPASLLQQFEKDHTIVKVLKGCVGDEKSVSVLYGHDLSLA